MAWTLRDEVRVAYGYSWLHFYGIKPLTRRDRAYYWALCFGMGK